MCFGLLFTLALSAQLRFEDFARPSGLRLLKDARKQNEVLRLAGTKTYQTGAVWSIIAQPVSAGFETHFRFRLSEPADNIYGGADGFAFVLQTEGPGVIGGRGASGGFSLGRGPNPKTKGIPRSLAIFFDTFKNDEEQDLSGNSIGLFTNGDGVFLPRRLAINAELPLNLKDGQPHEARIVYERPVLSVYLDQIAEPVLSASVEIASVTGSTGAAFVGFTAATGGGYQNHDLLSWSFTPVTTAVTSSIRFSDQDCLPERTLCTPASAKVERIGVGHYRVRLPAHLPWGASIEAPGVASIERATGIVCWDPESKSGPVCHGPEGNAAHTRPGLLDPASVPGTIVQQRRGNQIVFSINARTDTFDRNEGAFEFEVSVGQL